MEKCRFDIKENGCQPKDNLESENNTNGDVAGNWTPSVLKVHASNLAVTTGHKTGLKNAIAFDIEHSLVLNAMLVHWHITFSSVPLQ